MKIGIAGAGLLGRLLAWRLASLGHEISLFDKAAKQSFKPAGMVAAAMLAPVSEALISDQLIYSLGQKSLEFWPTWIEQLSKESGQKILFQQHGSLVVAHRQDAAELQRFIQRVASKGFIAKSDIEIVDRSRIKELEPELDSFEQACYLPTEACLHNWQLFSALEKILSKTINWFEETEVVVVEKQKIITREQTFEFDLVIDSRGFGAKNSLKNFRGVRGEVFWVEAIEVNITRPIRLMHPRYQLYIAPKGENLYVIGATEIESESLEPVSVRSSLELLSALYAVHKGFAEAKILEGLVNLRPAFFDNHPRIIQENGLISVNGLYRHGFLIGPAVVEDVLALITGSDVNFSEIVEAA